MGRQSALANQDLRSPGVFQSSKARCRYSVHHSVIRNVEEEVACQLKLMSDRIVAMRTALRSAVEAKGTPGTWNHITDQIGMFTYTGLNKDQSARMVEELHVYMTGDGRISMAGLNPGNVGYVAECIDKVVRG